jgi:hypothetical protein
MGKGKASSNSLCNSLLLVTYQRQKPEGSQEPWFLAVVVLPTYYVTLDTGLSPHLSPNLNI